MTVEFLDKIVLLSSAVADADNHTITHGKKLEVLSAIERLIPDVGKAEITQAHKKLEDLCLRMIFQDCPQVLVKLIVSVLSQSFARGSNSALHACVAFLFQLAVYNPKERSVKLDRPIPAGDDHIVSIHERSVCFSIAVGIVVSKGPSASYFVPNVIACMHKLMKLPDPAARESALRNLASVIRVIGVPGSKVGDDIFSNILFKTAYGERSPEVRIAAAHALADFCQRCRAVAIQNADSIQNLCLKILLSPADLLLKEFSLVGHSVVEARHAYCEILLQLIQAVMSEKSSDKIGLNLKAATDFSSAVLILFNIARKYKSSLHAVEALMTVAVRLVIALGEREEDVITLADMMVTDLSGISISVAERCIRRLIRCGEGDSGILRIVHETLMGSIREQASEASTIVALAGLVEAMSIVEGSIVALESDLGSDLVQLISRCGSSTPVAVNCAFTLRALCRVSPSLAFPLTNVLLNHITIQNAELAGSDKSTEHVYVRSILHFSIALAAVLVECADSLPQDVAAAVLSTAANLIGQELPETSPMQSISEYQKKTCGFILLLCLVETAAPITLMSLWKTMLGKRLKDTLIQAMTPGTVIEDIGPYLECFQAILACMRSVKQFLAKRGLELSEDLHKLTIALLNNVWQVTQAAAPLEHSTVSINSSLSLLVHAIRSEMYQSLLSMDSIDQMERPLSLFLTNEVTRDPEAYAFRTSPGTLYNHSVEVSDGTKKFSFLSSDLLDLTDPVFDPLPECEYDYALSVAVITGLKSLSISQSVEIRDFFSSSISAGSLEEFYLYYPASRGSPFCPLFPYLESTHPLQPLPAQMNHPVTESRVFGIRLLARLMGRLDRSSFDACVNALAVAYKAVDQVSSVEFEDENNPVRIANKTSCVVAAVAATTVLVFSSEPGKQASEYGSQTLLSLAASPIGLGALHPFTRRVSAAMIGAMYATKSSMGDAIFQCITDSAVSKTSRTRSATALLITSIVERTTVSGLFTFGSNLFKLSRELVLPTRACTLYALVAVCAALGEAIEPWTREIVKILTAHAVADIYSSPLSGMLISGVLAMIGKSLDSEQIRGVVLWESMRGGVEEWSKQNKSFGIITERFCVDFAPHALMDDRTTEYVIDEIGASIETCAPVCRSAIAALAAIADKSKTQINVSFYDALFSVCDTNPLLRNDVDMLLKVLLRNQGMQALGFIIDSLTTTASSSRTDGSDEPSDADDDYEEETKRDESKTNTKRRNFSVSTKSLMVKCIKRIVKSRLFVKNHSMLEKLINISVSSSGDSSVALATEGTKLLDMLVDIFGNDVVTVHRQHDLDEDDKPMPVLLQYETPIMSALRRGVRTNSDMSPEGQKILIQTLKKVVEKNICSSPSRLVELLVQPLVLVDPSSMPWSTVFVLREAANTVLSGRSPQTTEKEVSLILYKRISVLIDLVKLAVRKENEEILNEFRKHSEFLHYYLLRLLMDCGLVVSAPSRVEIQANLFSFIETDIGSLRPVVRDLLAPAVLEGLEISRKLEWGKIFCPMDCPFRADVDMMSIYQGVLHWISSEWLTQGITCDQLDRLVLPIELVTENSSKEILGTFLARPRDVENANLAHYEMLRMAHEIVSNESEYQSVDSLDQIVWNLGSIGMSPDAHDEDSLRMITRVAEWLISRQFFASDPSKTDLLVSECLFKLVKKQPQVIVKLIRDSVAEINNVGALCLLIDSVDKLFSSSLDSEVQFVIVLLIPVFSRLMAVSETVDEVVVNCLQKLRTSLLGCKSTHAAIQCVGKLLSVPSSVYLESFYVPTALELIARDPETAVGTLLLPLTTLCSHSVDSGWKKIVSLVVKVACVNDQEQVGKCLIVCMQTSIDVFKECLGDLSPEEKSQVELLVRKHLPRKEEPEKCEAQKNAEHSAPQIQLKLKFGKP